MGLKEDWRKRDGKKECQEGRNTGERGNKESEERKIWEGMEVSWDQNKGKKDKNKIQIFIEDIKEWIQTFLKTENHEGQKKHCHPSAMVCAI